MKKMGIPDSRIVVFLGEDIPCNTRNPFPGKIYAGAPSRVSPVYPLSFSSRVDVRSNEVNRQNFLDLLSGRYKPFMPRDRRIASGPDSSVFVYFSGHSAVGYTKFQDFEDVAAGDIADGFESMRIDGRYKDLLWISDTCRAASLHNEFYSPGIIAIGSSSEQDKAYSHHRIGEIGQSLIDRFTMSTQDAFRKLGVRNITLGEYFGHLDPKFLGSIPSIKTDLYTQNWSTTKLNHFIGNTNTPVRITVAKTPYVFFNTTATETDTFTKIDVFSRHENMGKFFQYTESPKQPTFRNTLWTINLAVFVCIGTLVFVA